MNKYSIILLFSVLISSISQIILKKSANKNYESIIKEYMNLYVLTGYALLFLSTILTIFALKGLPYKSVPIIETIGYIYILLLSRLLLKEKITKKMIIGNVIIISGVIVFNM